MEDGDPDHELNQPPCDEITNADMTVRSLSGHMNISPSDVVGQPSDEPTDLGRVYKTLFILPLRILSDIF